MNKLQKLIAILGLAGFPAFAQLTTTSTTTSAAVTATGQNGIVCVASATGINVPAVTTTGSYLGIEQEAMQVTATAPGTNCYRVRRGTQGTAVAAHASGAKVWVGNPAISSGDPSRPFSGGAFIPTPPAGSCTSTAQYTLPLIIYASPALPNQTNGDEYTCGLNGQWGKLKSFWVDPTMCTFAPTTLTTTNTYIQLGASTLFVLNGTSNAAAGTNTLTCTIELPAKLSTSSPATLDTIELYVGSQTTAPTSVGSATLGSITFSAPATGGAASTVTPVTQGGTITTVTPTALTTVTTAGAFVTMGYTFSSAVALNVDRRILRFTQPFVQSAASAMTINTPGLLVRYIEER